MQRISNTDTARIIADMLRGINARNVLDCTYGVGRFYKYYRPAMLVGIDPNIYGGSDYIVKPDVLIPKPIWAAIDVLRRLGIRFDAAVIDPPFRKRPRGYDKRKYYYNIIGTPELILEYAFKLASELNIPYVLLHWRDTYNPNSYNTIETIEYTYRRGYIYTKSYFILYRLNKRNR